MRRLGQTGRKFQAFCLILCAVFAMGWFGVTTAYATDGKPVYNIDLGSDLTLDLNDSLNSSSNNKDADVVFNNPGDSEYYRVTVELLSSEVAGVDSSDLAVLFTSRQNNSSGSLGLFGVDRKTPKLEEVGYTEGGMFSIIGRETTTFEFHLVDNGTEDGSLRFGARAIVRVRIDCLYDLMNNTTIKLSSTKFTYNGKAHKPAVLSVVYKGKTLRAGVDYTVSYVGNVEAGDGWVDINGKGIYVNSDSAGFTIERATNKLSVKAKTATVKQAKLEKKNQTLKVSKVLTIRGAKGTVSFKKKSGNKKITINKKNGKVTVKKGLKKGTYKVKVIVKANGGYNYKAATKIVTFKIKVK